MKKIVALACTAAALSCSDTPAQDGRSNAVVSDSAGVRIVTTPAAADSALQLRETLRLGREDGEGPDLFSGVVAVLLDEEGRVIVGNAGSHSVRVFNSAGVLESEFGKRGGGPAEVEWLDDVVRGGDTIIMVNWQRGGQAVVFRRDGTFIHSFDTRRADGLRHTPVGGSPRGWLWSYNAEGSFRVPPGDSLVQAARIGIMSLDSIGPVQPLYAFEGTTLYGAPGSEGGVDWGMFRTRRATGFDAAGRMYRSDPESYRIDVRDGSQLVMSVRREFTPYRIRPEDIEAVGDEVNAVIDTLTLPDEDYRRQERAGMAARVARWKTMPIPAVLSPIRSLLVSHDGSMWVEIQDTTNPARAEAAASWGRRSFPATATHWHLYDAAGAFLGGVELPARFRAEAVSGSTVVGVFANENDVEFVVRYKAGG